MIVVMGVRFIANQVKANDNDGDNVMYMPIVRKTLFLSIADFNNCTKYNNLGGEMGSAYVKGGPDILQESYPLELNRGCVAKLEYDNQVNWSAFWMKLMKSDWSPYNRLLFNVRMDNAPTNGLPMKIEIKRVCREGDGTTNCDEVEAVYQNVTSDWEPINIPLSQFCQADGSQPFSEFTEMEELVFVFELNHGWSQGAVYLDNVQLIADGLPQLPSPCTTALP